MNGESPNLGCNCGEADVRLTANSSLLTLILGDLAFPQPLLR